jgi:hypothetical protein
VPPLSTPNPSLELAAAASKTLVAPPLGSRRPSPFRRRGGLPELRKQVSRTVVLLELELVPHIARARSPKFAAGCCPPRRAARHQRRLRVCPSAIDRSFALQASLRCKPRHKPCLLALDRVCLPESSARLRSLEGSPSPVRRRPAARVHSRPIWIG